MNIYLHAANLMLADDLDPKTALTRARGEAIRQTGGPVSDPQPLGRNFEAVLGTFIKAGLSRGHAVRLAVETHPDLHDEYCQRVQGGEKGAF